MLGWSRGLFYLELGGFMFLSGLFFKKLNIFQGDMLGWPRGLFFLKLGKISTTECPVQSLIFFRETCWAGLVDFSTWNWVDFCY